MDELMTARALFGSSLGFHILFATLGVGLPLMIFMAELLFQVTKDKDYTLMAKRWTKAQAILLGVAIPSGTIVAVQLSLLWPHFMEWVGQIIALPFQVELFAFFLEALFMSIYVYAADRLSPTLRILSVFFVALGGSLSGALITSANAWMNTPTGFDLAKDGSIIHVRPWEAFFNPSFPAAAIHVLFSAYMTGAFVIASIAALRMLKRKKKDAPYHYHRKALMLSLAIGLIMSLGTAMDGHWAGQVLHEKQPEKLAAAEGLFETQSYAPLALGGVTDTQEQRLKGAVEIPWMLSFLAGNRFDTVVQGLNDFPRDTWPPSYTHTLFSLMIGIGTLLMILAGFVWLYRWRKGGDHLPRWLLRLLTVGGPLSLLAIEFGWVFTCSGRQPWTVYQYQRTSEAVTAATGLMTWFVLFISIYVLLLISTIWIMRSYFRKRPIEQELGFLGLEGRKGEELH
ncbi:cytochrome ubiquinol oxidase subunit I [Marininema halotolerans]|uniref:Cytochrome d ubiquinol oxidase subunit I n=1 Tax=Marininema halotolerans TaxID=1155944 RepID=A0A1I6T0T1_9BACL|nr:cytochrome ubiquinol oxidase subunit I [Marininema halotolerans]SFS82736.1 cytochrome d ubiquinol oxidase subunit I [Marininema halotolerans]